MAHGFNIGTAIKSTVDKTLRAGFCKSVRSGYQNIAIMYKLITELECPS
jgi:hypothetical protein